MTLDSTVSQPNHVWDIYFTVCIGAGRTGTIAGADGGTSNFGALLYSSCYDTINVISVTPSLTSQYTACTAPAILSPPNTFLNEQGSFVYDASSCMNGFTCILTTALCGNVTSECYQIHLRMVGLPDSIHVIGVEGGGNPYAGCYPNSDMVIVFPPTAAAVQAAFTYTNAGSTASFSDQSLGSPASYLWDFGDGSTASSANPTHTYASEGSYAVCLTAIAGCDTSTVCDTICIRTCSTPSFSVGINGLVATFSNATTFGAQPPLFHWDFGDGNGSNLQNPVHAYAIPDTYMVCLFTYDTSMIGGLIDTCCTGVFYGTALPCVAPSAAFSYAVNGLTVTFTDQSTLPSPLSTTFEWWYGDSTAMGVTQNASHTYPSSGTYLVCHMVADPCGRDTVYQMVTVGPGTGLPNPAVAPILFPNPTTGTLNIQVGATAGSTVRYMWHDLSARKLAEGTGRIDGQRIRLDATFLPRGRYLLALAIDGNWSLHTIEVAQ